MKADEQPSEEQHLQELQAALQKLPRIHLIVLDTLLKHLKEYVPSAPKCSAHTDVYSCSLIDNTAAGEEPNDVYISKLALSLGRGTYNVDGPVHSTDI